MTDKKEPLSEKESIVEREEPVAKESIVQTRAKTKEKNETLEEVIGMLVDRLSIREEKLSEREDKLLVQLGANVGKNERIEVPHFSGASGEDVNEWLFLVKQHYKNKECNSEEKLRRTSGLLREEALRWYIEEEEQIRTFEMFTEELKRKFESHMDDDYWRLKLEKIRHEQEFEPFVESFKKTIGKIRVISMEEKISIFKRALKFKTKQELDYRKPKTLEEAINMARSYQEIYFSSKMIRRPVGVRKTAYLQQGKGEVTCFSCLAKGHFARNCPKIKKVNLTGEEINKECVRRVYRCR